MASARIFLVFYAEAAADPDTREEVINYMRNWRRVFYRVIVEAQAAGQIDQLADPAKLASELAAASDGLALHAMLDPEVMRQLTEGNLEIELLEGGWRLAPAAR